jgi:hypothetical protein
MSSNDRKHVQQQQQQQPNRHRYIVYPVPDATTRLDRWNTKKWKRIWNSLFHNQPRQRGYYLHLSIQEIAKIRWIERMHLTGRSGTFMTTTTIITTKTTSESDDVDENDGNINPSRLGLGHHDHPLLLQLWSPTLEKSLLLQCTSSISSSCLFLPGVTVLASYPRSGNTLVRQWLENVTGFVTGSDTRSDRPLSIALAEQHGLVGEGIVPNNNNNTNNFGPPICKTHWPERMGCTAYHASRVILLVRNPWDALDSYWHLNATNTHTEKVTKQVYQDHGDMFEDMVKNELLVWSQFLDFYYPCCSCCCHNNESEGCRNNNNHNHRCSDVLLVRYEDLMLHPMQQMERMLQFCTPTDWWRSQLQVIFGTLQPKLNQTQPYPLSSRRGYPSYNRDAAIASIGRSLQSGIYSPQLLHEIHNKLREGSWDPHRWLQRLGYDLWSQNFPHNLLRLPELPQQLHISTTTTTLSTHQYCHFGGVGTIHINDDMAKELRPRTSPFGRNMRQWRRQHTNNDQDPFPTQQKRQDQES